MEKKLLEDALHLELINGIEHRQPLRLKEDRNLCAHTCLRSLGDASPRLATTPGPTSWPR
ncbi:hypothetical protein [Streptomyces sp. NPDC005732]|uniref:hypothetical protein n=1 Tax=Streptomyces sp. NPDC005732 TaxID=3157057 RepID=UPI0033C6A05A